MKYKKPIASSDSMMKQCNGMQWFNIGPIEIQNSGSGLRPEIHVWT